MTNSSKFVEIDIAVISAANMPKVVQAAKSGDPELRYLAAAVGEYLQHKIPGAECALCDHTFDEHHLACAFMVLTVVDEGKGHMVVAGICPQCCDQDRDALRAAVEKSVRGLYPSFRPTPPRPALNS